MTITTTFNNIGFGSYANSEIAIIDQYDDGNDYEGSYVEVDGKFVAGDITTGDAIRAAFKNDAETAEFILRKMRIA